MSEQASNANDTQATAQDAAAKPDAKPQAGESVSAADVSALREQLKVQAAELERARNEAAKYRKRNDDETAARLKEQGDFKALYEREVPDLKQKAGKYESWAEKMTAKVEAEIPSLPSYVQKAIKAVAAVEDKIEILDDFKREQAEAQAKAATDAAANQPKPQPTKQAPNGASPASPTPPVDVRSMPIEQLRAGLRDDKQRASILAGLGVKPKESRLDPFGRPT